MSFYVNNSELNQIKFNGSNVNSVYFNNDLVWQIDWEKVYKWDDMSWSDVYQMCKAKQSGAMSNYPSTITLGATKNVEVAGEEVPVRLIGIDQDGPGVLTFQAFDGYGGVIHYGDSWKDKSKCNYDASNVKVQCNNFYNNCNVKNYIKPLSKKYCINQTSLATTTKTLYVWLPSASEMGVTSSRNASAVINEGSPYQFFVDYVGTKWVGEFYTRSVSKEKPGTNIIDDIEAGQPSYYVGDKLIITLSHNPSNGYWGCTTTWVPTPDSINEYSNWRFAPAFAIG